MNLCVKITFELRDSDIGTQYSILCNGVSKNSINSAGEIESILRETIGDDKTIKFMEILKRGNIMFSVHDVGEKEVYDEEIMDGNKLKDSIPHSMVSYEEVKQIINIPNDLDELILLMK